MSTKKLLLLLFSWRILLLIFVYLGIQIFPLQKNFLGGGMENYLSNPYLWSWANFDGEHYLALAKEGYRPLTYFFFPVYPLLIRLLGENYQIFSGLLISHVALFVGLIGLVRLIRLDYKEKIANWTIILLLFFPTSFYLGSVYTESLFLALTVWSLYFARQKKWLLAGVLGAFSTATRIFGLALIPTLMIEYYKRKKKGEGINLSALGGIILIPFGLLVYMYYLYITTSDALAFFNNISIFGEQRSTNLILFPQVFYRYIFKIIPALNFNYFPIVFTTFLEIISASIFLLVISIMFYKKMWSYAVFSLSIFTIEAFSGSFSSFPRYALSIFPVFIMLSLWLSSQKLYLKSIVLGAFGIGLAIATALFSRGFWVS